MPKHNGKELPLVVIENSITSENVSELEKVARIQVMDPYASLEDWIKATHEAIAIIDRKTTLSREILAGAQNLRLIARTGMGVDNTRVHLDTAREKGILITYNPGVNADSVAELTILLALSVNRHLLEVNKLVKEAQWGAGQKIRGNQIKGKKWGVIGFGNAGVSVARAARGLGAEILAYDPYLSQMEIKRREGQPRELEELLMESDIISIHVPLMESTRHLIGRKEFSLMKKSAVIINVSRGGIIDDKALYNAVKDGQIRGAGLDTLEDEPVHPDNPLLKAENVVITPHIGGSTEEDLNTGAYKAVEEVINFLNGKEPTHPYPLT